MRTTKAYDDLVQGFRDKIRGNVSSAKLSPEEMQAEIAAVQDGAISNFDSEPHQNAWKGQAPIGSMEMPNSQQPKRRGRPPGSRNKPKA